MASPKSAALAAKIADEIDAEELTFEVTAAAAAEKAAADKAAADKAALAAAKSVPAKVVITDEPAVLAGVVEAKVYVSPRTLAEMDAGKASIARG